MNDQSNLPFYKRDIKIKLPQQNLLAWIGVMTFVAFLPSTIIFYGSLFLIVIAPLYLAVRNATAHPFFSRFIYIIFGIGLVSALFAPAVLVILFLLFMGPYSFLIMVWPTVINLLTSYWLAGLTGKSGLKKIWIVTAISILLGFNVRLPSLIWDLVNLESTKSINNVLEISSSQPLILESNSENINFRLSRFEPIGIGGNEGCMCMYWTPPKKIIENIEDSLQRQGIRYKINGVIGPKLIVNTTKNDGVTTLSATLWDGETQTASMTQRLRSAYPFEEKFDKKQSINNINLRANYLLENNVWNFLLSPSDKGYTNSEYPLRNFISEAISIKKSPEEIKLNNPKIINAVLTSENHSKLFDQSIDFRAGRLQDCGDSVKVGLRYDSYRSGNGYGTSLTGETVSFESNEERYTELIKGNIEKIICSESGSYVIGSAVTEATTKHDIYTINVQKFTPNGVLLENFKITLPKLQFKGVPRKAITNFNSTKDEFTFTVTDFDYQSRKIFSTYSFIASK